MTISCNREFDGRFEGAAIISKNNRPCFLAENMERLRDHDIDVCEPRPITLMLGPDVELLDVSVGKVLPERQARVEGTARLPPIPLLF